MIDDEPWRTIRAAIQSMQPIAEQLTVPVVANLKPTRTLDQDHSATSVATEYFSENEASQVMLAFQECGCYTRFYAGELAFIAASLNGEIDRLPRRYKLVYNVAQSGTGPGRKSLMPAFCTLQNIAICNSDPYVVSLARHKFHVQCVLRTIGIPTPDSWLYDLRLGWLANRRPPSDALLIAKACYESASIGLTNDSVGVLSNAYEQRLRTQAAVLRQPLIVQRFVPGYEVEVPIIEAGGGVVTLDPVSITLEGETLLGDRFLDYDLVDYDSYGFAASHHLAAETIESLRAAALAAFTALGIRGIGRVDFRVSSKDGSIAVTDVATSPHLVQHSSFAFAFQQAGLSHTDLFAAMLAANAQRYNFIDQLSDHT